MVSLLYLPTDESTVKIEAVSFIFSIPGSSRNKTIIILNALFILFKFQTYLFFFQLIHLDYDVNANSHLDSSNNQYLIIATLFILVFDILLYLVLTLYLDKILPSK